MTTRKAARTQATKSEEQRAGDKVSAGKGSADTGSADQASSSEAGEAKAQGSAKKSTGRGAAAVAGQILAEESPAASISDLGDKLSDSRSTVATQAARVLSEIVAHKPSLVVPLVDRFVAGLTSKHKRVVQTSAESLPAVAKIAPARVARHLETLKNSFEPATAVGRDGLVRTFATLCAASVAYQKRLEPSLTTALESADGKTLVQWSQAVLPALKGEPHARARAVVEGRLDRIPRELAQQIADFLGVKLRPRYR